MKNSGRIHKRMVAAGEIKDLETPLLPPSGTKLVEDEAPKNFLKKLRDSSLQIAEEFMSPPTVAAVMGLIVGATPWLKSLIIGAAAPLRAVYDSINLMGSTIPLILSIKTGHLLSLSLSSARMMQERNDTQHHAHLGREPHPRNGQIKIEDVNNPGRPLHEDDPSSGDRDRNHRDSGKNGLPPGGSSFSIHPSHPVHNPSGHEHRNNGGAFRRGQRGVLRSLPLSLTLWSSAYLWMLS